MQNENHVLWNTEVDEREEEEGILKSMHEETMNKKLSCLNSSTATVLTAGGSATILVVKSLGSHVSVEMSGAECTGQLL